MFYFDYHALKPVVKAESQVLPKIREKFNYPQCIRVFHTLDLLSRYWEIKLRDRYKEVKSVLTRYGTNLFEVLSSKLINAPARLQNVMNQLLEEVFLARAYLDDVVRFSKYIEDHFLHLNKIIWMISNHNLKLKFWK